MSSSVLTKILQKLNLEEEPNGHLITGWPSAWFMTENKENSLIVSKSGYVVGLVIFPTVMKGNNVSLYFKCFSSKKEAYSVFNDIENKIRTGYFKDEPVYKQIKIYLEDKIKISKDWCFAKFFVSDGLNYS